MVNQQLYCIWLSNTLQSHLVLRLIPPFSVWLHYTWFGLGLDRNWLKRATRWRVEMKLAVGLWPLLLAAWPCTAVVLEKPAQHKRSLPKGLLRPCIGGWEQQGCTFWLGTRSIQQGQKWSLQVCSSNNCIAIVVQLFESISLHISNDREKHLYLVKKNNTNWKNLSPSHFGLQEHGTTCMTTTNLWPNFCTWLWKNCWCHAKSLEDWVNSHGTNRPCKNCFLEKGIQKIQEISCTFGVNSQCLLGIPHYFGLFIPMCFIFGACCFSRDDLQGPLFVHIPKTAGQWGTLWFSNWTAISSDFYFVVQKRGISAVSPPFQSTV